jgi:hypothetical protein
VQAKYSLPTDAALFRELFSRRVEGASHGVDERLD